MYETLASVDYARLQFAVTALYHFLFVPLTLGLSFIVAIMESLYVRSGDERWKKITRFWMTLFAINFAIGVATGIIMEFEFGTNWSNYAWFVGDIFGAPLAVEGILAFFLESTFFAVMFFGWDRVGKGFHLLSTWLVAIGSNLSALWILVANGWMQYPVGMHFNPDLFRYEMVSFFDVLLSPVAIIKFLHTVGGGYVTSALFVTGVSAWFILKQRDMLFAKRSIVVSASFGLLVSLFVVLTGDESAHQVAQKQPAKLAAMEGIYDGENRAGIVGFGVLRLDKSIGDAQSPFYFDVTIPYALSLLGYHDINAFVPGIDDLVYGNEAKGLRSASQRIESGKIAVSALADYKRFTEANQTVQAAQSLALLQAHIRDFGYGYLERPEQIIPPVAPVFYAFHTMAGLGFWFVLLFVVILFLLMANDITKHPFWLYAAWLSWPLGFIACELGWVVAEVGRQPWAVQDMLPVHIAMTDIASSNVMISVIAFAAIFTLLLIAEVRIMLKQISNGMEGAH